MKKNRLMPTWIFSIILLLYIIYALCDAFVIPKNIHEAPQLENNDNKSISIVSITDTSYESDDISINITKLRKYDTDIYVVDIVLDNINSLRAGLAKNSFGRNITQTTSVMAENNNAILAINGDYYGFRDEGIVMRNRYLYRKEPRAGEDALVIYDNGDVKTMKETDIDVTDVANVLHIFSFGPALLSDGKVMVNNDSEVENHMASNPRTAFGMIEPLHYIWIVSDGRTDESKGLSLVQLAEIFENYNCSEAYNLDGGGSSTMWFNGKIVNFPTSGWSDGERSVSDIVYIGE